MSELTLGAGTPVEHEAVKIDDGELVRVYRPRPMVRSVKKAFARNAEDLARLYARVNRSRGDMSDADEESAMRFMCNQIGLLVTGSVDETPDAGDLLYEGWMADRVTDDQIIGLYNDLLGISREGEEDDPS